MAHFHGASRIGNYYAGWEAIGSGVREGYQDGKLALAIPLHYFHAALLHAVRIFFDVSSRLVEICGGACLRPQVIDLGKIYTIERLFYSQIKNNLHYRRQFPQLDVMQQTGHQRGSPMHCPLQRVISLGLHLLGDIVSLISTAHYFER